MSKNIAIIGSGISGLAAAAYAAKAGNKVHVFEKHEHPGGRARQFKTDNGYTFDMGPSWYWMPDIIDNFFNDFGYQASDFFELKALDPQFEMVFEDGNLNVPKNYGELRNMFENMETGSGKQFDAFMQSAKYKYEVGMQDFVQKPCHTWMEFASLKIAKSAMKLDLLSDFRSYVAKYFKNSKLRKLMEFPVIFLGAAPKNIPAMYSLMNYGGYALGTWYPIGGFYQLVLAMQKIAAEEGVTFHFNKNVEKIITTNGTATGLEIDGSMLTFDAIIASSDYHHAETLLPQTERNYSESYWQQRTFAPSCLIFYIGFNRKIDGLKHHTLFFEKDFDHHIDSIYETKSWPEQALFYACCPSKTDETVMPAGHENVFLLMPLAIGLTDDEATREKYFMDMIKRLASHSGIDNLEQYIDYKRSYCVSDFKQDYNAYQGNAYGLANTLKQTAVLKPSIRNKKIRNLLYTGQLTVPGPGVPPSIISGKIAAQEIQKLKN